MKTFVMALIFASTSLCHASENVQLTESGFAGNELLINIIRNNETSCKEVALNIKNIMDRLERDKSINQRLCVLSTVCVFVSLVGIIGDGPSTLEVGLAAVFAGGLGHQAWSWAQNSILLSQWEDVHGYLTNPTTNECAIETVQELNAFLSKNVESCQCHSDVFELRLRT